MGMSESLKAQLSCDVMTIARFLQDSEKMKTRAEIQEGTEELTNNRWKTAVAKAKRDGLICSSKHGMGYYYFHADYETRIRLEIKALIDEAAEKRKAAEKDARANGGKKTDGSYLWITATGQSVQAQIPFEQARI